ncbi:MAG: NMD3-related protein [Candidatus Diapherotrites archaeon]
MKRFCASCGKETNDLISSLCSVCYLKNYKVVELPDKILVDVDKKTGKFRFGRYWLYPEESVIYSFLRDKLEKSLVQKKLPLLSLKVSLAYSEKKILCNLLFETKIDNVLLQVSKDLVLVLNSTISDSSMKLSSNYHEAIIQIRFLEKHDKVQEKEKLREMLSILRKYKTKDELSEAVDIKQVKGGVDVFVGSKKAAKKVSEYLAKKYGIKIIYSNKLLGLKEGKEYFRDYFCLKF